jgi:cobalt-zinc-cadmium efflux system outer membrane protein
VEFARRLGAGSGGAEGVFDAADGVTLAEAEVVALFYNPALRVARLRAGVSAAEARYAGLWSDPVLGLSAERVLESVERAWVVGGVLDVTIPVSGRLRAAKARAGAAHAAALARVAEQEWGTRLRLRGAWLEWSAALERAGVLERALARVEEAGVIVAKMEEAGELGRLDARALRMEAVSRRVALAEERARAADLELSIRGLMGLSPGAPLVLEPTLVQVLQENPEGNGVEGSPSLLVLGAEYEAAEHALRREVRAQYPDITVGPGASRDQGEWRALAGVSLPIPLWNRNQGGVARAAAERDVARAVFEARLEELEIELAQARAAHEAARARRESLERDLIPLADEQGRDARRVAELGGVSTLLLLDTLERETGAREQLIAARLDESLSAVRAGALLGPPPGPAALAPPLNETGEMQNETGESPVTGERP